MTKKIKGVSFSQQPSGRLAKDSNTTKCRNVKKHTNRGRSVEPCRTPDTSAASDTQFQASPIDLERVEKIKRAIEKEEYKIDATRVAEKLLRLEEEIWGDKDNT